MTRLSVKIAATGLILGLILNLAAGPVATLLAAEPDPVPGVQTRYFGTILPFTPNRSRATDRL